MLTVHNNKIVDGQATQEVNLAVNLGSGKVIVTYIEKELSIHDYYHKTYNATAPLSDSEVKQIAKIKSEELIKTLGQETYNSLMISAWKELTGIRPMMANGDLIFSTLEARQYLAAVDYLIDCIG